VPAVTKTAPTIERKATVPKVSSVEPSSPYLGALLRTAWQWVRDQVTADVAASGHQHLTSAHLQVFRYPSPDGLRPSELAQRLQITKQSVNDLVGHLELHGYLVREADPLDGRAKVVRLTGLGRRLERDINTAARAAEERITELLGRQRARELRSILQQLFDEVGQPDRPGDA